MTDGAMPIPRQVVRPSPDEQAAEAARKAARAESKRRAELQSRRAALDLDRLRDVTAAVTARQKPSPPRRQAVAPHVGHRIEYRGRQFEVTAVEADGTVVLTSTTSTPEVRRWRW